MIIVKTKMKKIPELCTKCPYSKNYNAIKGFIKESYKVCILCHNKIIKSQYIPERKNHCYIRPKWCPLIQVED